MAGERTLPGLGLTGFWDLGSGYKGQMDTNLRLLSALVQLSVKDRDAALPGSPSTGDIYIVESTDSTHPNEIAIWDGEPGSEAWVYVSPGEGWIAYVEDEALHYLYDGSAWVTLNSGGSGSMDQTEETGAFSVTNAMLAGDVVKRANFSAAADVTVPSGLTNSEPLTVIATGSGQVSFVADSGVTIHSADGNLKLRAQYSSGTLVPDSDAADTYYLIGDLDA